MTHATTHATTSRGSTQASPHQNRHTPAKHPAGVGKAHKPQRGVALLEALIAILVFSLGILSVLAIQATSIRMAAEAQYRTRAILLANRLIGAIWTSGGSFDDIADKFSSPNGSAYKAWLASAQDPEKGGFLLFEEGTNDDPTVEIVDKTVAKTGNKDPGAFASVTIRIRWRTPSMKASDPSRLHIVTSQISRNPT